MADELTEVFWRYYKEEQKVNAALGVFHFLLQISYYLDSQVSFAQCNFVFMTCHGCMHTSKTTYAL